MPGVTINNTGPRVTVRVNQSQTKRVRVVGVSQILGTVSGNLVDELDELLDVDSSGADDGEIVVRDSAAANGKQYTVKTLPRVDGGTY